MSNKLPTAEETLNKYHGDYRFMAPEDRQELLDAIESHTTAHTAALRERVRKLQARLNASEEANSHLAAHQCDNWTPTDHGDWLCTLKSDNASLRERLKQLEAKIASYESAIEGLKKVVDSLYNLKS